MAIETVVAKLALVEDVCMSGIRDPHVISEAYGTGRLNRCVAMHHSELTGTARREHTLE